MPQYYDIEILNNHEGPGQLHVGRMATLLKQVNTLSEKALALYVGGYSEFKLETAFKRQNHILYQLPNTHQDASLLTFTADTLQASGVQTNAFLKIEPNKTALSVLIETLHKAIDPADQEIDLALLTSIQGIDKVLLGDDEVLRFSNRGTVEAVNISTENLAIVAAKMGQVPSPATVTVSGVLEVMSYSDHSLKLKTIKGEVVPLRIEKSQLQTFKEYFGKLIVVSGTAHYKQNNTVSYLDGISLLTNADKLVSVTSQRPDRLTSRQQVEKQLKAGKARNSLQDFFGTWPGNETDDEWNEMLKTIR